MYANAVPGLQRAQIVFGSGPLSSGDEDRCWPFSIDLVFRSRNSCESWARIIRPGFRTSAVELAVGCNLSRRVVLGLIGSLLRILAAEDSIEQAHCVSVESRHHMAVGVHRRRYRAVAEHVLNHLGVDAFD